MHPVLEVYASDDFAFWPVMKSPPHGYLVLSGDLTPAEVGAAVSRIAGCNDIDPEDDARPPRPADPLGSFLHGLLTVDNLFAPGGLRVTDSATKTEFAPGCCNGLEDWRCWYQVLDGTGPIWFGHDPDPRAERCGNTVRLTLDAEQSNSPVIEVPAAELRQLIDRAERDLVAFLGLVAKWADRYVPDQAGPVAAAVARALDLPSPSYAP